MLDVILKVGCYLKIGFQFLNMLNISHQGYLIDKQYLKLYIQYTYKITVENNISQKYLLYNLK